MDILRINILNIQLEKYQFTLSNNYVKL